MDGAAINQEGGQRRLNVAITRPRVGVTIIGPYDLDIDAQAKTRALPRAPHH